MTTTDPTPADATATALHRDGDTIAPFSHRSLAPLPEYRRVLVAIDTFAGTEHGLDSAAFVVAVRDIAALRTMPSPCPRCSVAAHPRFCLPIAADVAAELVTAHYLCPRCASTWSTDFAQPDDTAEPGKR